eukprot:99404-Pleurochrysis_carterae.AAC.3
MAHHAINACQGPIAAIFASHGLIHFSRGEYPRITLYCRGMAENIWRYALSTRRVRADRSTPSNYGLYGRYASSKLIFDSYTAQISDKRRQSPLSHMAGGRRTTATLDHRSVQGYEPSRCGGKESLKNSLINFGRFRNFPANEMSSLARCRSELTCIRSGLDRWGTELARRSAELARHSAGLAGRLVCGARPPFHGARQNGDRGFLPAAWNET